MTAARRALTVYDGLLLAFLATAAGSAAIAFDAAAAWRKFGWLLAALVVFWLLRMAARRQPQRALWLPTLTAVALALYFIAFHDWAAFPAKNAALTALGRALQTPLPAVSVPQFHPNVVAGALALLLPFALATCVATVGRARLAAAAAVAVVLLALLLTLSRGAWLALLIAGGVAAVWVVLGRSAAWRRRRPVVLGGLALLAVAATLLLMVAAPATAEALFTATVSGSERLNLYRDGRLMAGDYPLLGGGLGGFSMLHASYAFLAHVPYSTHSHNLYLDLIIEQSSAALLLLLALWLLAALALLRRPMLSAPQAAAGLSLLVLALHGLIDDPLYSSRALPLLFVPLAWIEPTERLRLPRRAALLVLALLLTLAALRARPLAAALLTNAAAVAQSRAELSRYRWPEWPVQDALRRTVDLRRPIALYTRALALDPDQPAAQRRLGQILLSLGEYEAAQRHLAAAHARHPSRTTAQLLGEALIAGGDSAAGTPYWQQAGNAAARLDLRILWYRTQGEAVIAAALEAALPPEK